MAKRPVEDKSVCRNRKAEFRFEILEKIECGIVLRGSEIKSLRERAASIEEAYARIEENEVWLIGCHIAPYSHAAATSNHEPLRRRKLLLHRQEIRKLLPRVEQKGQTLVPLRIFFNERGIAKVTLGLARGKTASDKRHTLKEREDRREIERSLKRR